MLLGLEPDRARQRLVTTVTDELPSWLDGLRLAGVRAFGRTWTIDVEAAWTMRRMTGEAARDARRPDLSGLVPGAAGGYGGTERVVSLLADGLVDAGHDVTLFASGDSHTRARLESVFHDGAERVDRAHVLGDAARAARLPARHDEFDIIHDHTGMLGLAFGGLLETPFCHTVHGPLDGQPGRIYEQIARARAEARS